MTVQQIASHAVLLALLVSASLDSYSMKRLRASTSPWKRVSAYCTTLSLLLACCCVSLWVLPPEQIWTPFSQAAAPHFLIRAVACLPIIAFCYVAARPVFKVWRRPELREKTDRQFAPAAFILPQTRFERALFFVLCLGAGFGEELVYRSFLIFYFEQAPYHLALPLAVAASAVVFGLGHLYQGPKGALSTLLVALGFTLFVFGTGSLWIAMILHALIDLRVLPLTIAKPST